jgi:enamine deaminase RidA (YjgF/YER057c/UK114 family)
VKTGCNLAGSSKDDVVKNSCFVNDYDDDDDDDDDE